MFFLFKDTDSVTVILFKCLFLDFVIMMIWKLN